MIILPEYLNQHKKMSKKTCLLLLLVLLIQSCNGQTTSNRKIHNKDFNWTIIIPEKFENVSSDEWKKMENNGAEAVEKTYDEKVINRAKTIFVFKSDEHNYFESNYQPFDPAIDGDYLESCKNVDNMLCETFQTQLQGITIDTTTTISKIDHLEFHTFNMTIKYPNKMVLNLIMYSRLFEKKEFTVNIMYVDKQKGNQMLESWMNSKFTNELK
jgi:hypothetical protein